MRESPRTLFVFALALVIAGAFAHCSTMRDGRPSQLDDEPAVYSRPAFDPPGAHQGGF